MCFRANCGPLLHSACVCSNEQQLTVRKASTFLKCFTLHAGEADSDGRLWEYEPTKVCESKVKCVWFGFYFWCRIEENTMTVKVWCCFGEFCPLALLEKFAHLNSEIMNDVWPTWLLFPLKPQRMAGQITKMRHKVVWTRWLESLTTVLSFPHRQHEW